MHTNKSTNNDDMYNKDSRAKKHSGIRSKRDENNPPITTEPLVTNDEMLKKKSHSISSRNKRITQSTAGSGHSIESQSKYGEDAANYSVKLSQPKKVNWKNKDVLVYRVESKKSYEKDLEFVIYIPVDTAVKWHKLDKNGKEATKHKTSGNDPNAEGYNYRSNIKPVEAVVAPDVRKNYDSASMTSGGNIIFETIKDDVNQLIKSKQSSVSDSRKSVESGQSKKNSLTSKGSNISGDRKCIKKSSAVNNKTTEPETDKQPSSHGYFSDDSKQVSIDSDDSHPNRSVAGIYTVNKYNSEKHPSVNDNNESAGDSGKRSKSVSGLPQPNSSESTESEDEKPSGKSIQNTSFSPAEPKISSEDRVLEDEKSIRSQKSDDEETSEEDIPKIGRVQKNSKNVHFNIPLDKSST